MIVDKLPAAVKYAIGASNAAISDFCLVLAKNEAFQARFDDFDPRVDY